MNVFVAVSFAAVDAVQDAVRRDVLDLVGHQLAVVATAPAGAGMSHFIATTVGELRRAQLRLAVVTPKNHQICSLVDRISSLNPGPPVAFVPATGKTVPPHVAARPGVSQPKASDAQATRA